MNSQVTVHISGSMSELTRVTAAARKLDESGYVKVIGRWWAGESDMPAVEMVGIEEQRQRAMRRIDGLALAQIVWVLWPDYANMDAACEYGRVMSTGSYREIIVTGARAHTCAFTALADFRDPSDEVGAFEALRAAQRIRDLREPKESWTSRVNRR